MKPIMNTSTMSMDFFRKSYRASLLLIGPYRSQSTASTEAKPEKIGKNLSFRPAYDSPIKQESRPLVLLYGWLVAKSKHIHKYGDFYLKKGFDVLHIKVDPFQLMWPANAQKVVSQVVDFTQQSPRTSQPVLVHGFSVGGYLYGETLVKFHSSPDTADNMAGRLRGQIFDSPVHLDRIPLGVSRAVTPIPALQKTLQASLNGYLLLTRNHTMRHYERSFGMFKENKFRAPTMFLYSKADKIGVPEPIDALIEDFRRRGIEAYGHCWPNSVHVSHFHTYPVEYIGALNAFLQETGLVKEAIPDKIKVTA